MVNARQFSRTLKEKVEINLSLTDNISDSELAALKTKLGKEGFVAATQYISKEDAAKEFETEYGEEFTDILGFNPLDNTLILYLQEGYTHNDSLQMIEAKLGNIPDVKEVNYPKNLIHLINENIRKLGLFLLAISMVFLFVTITLIDNTIKLTMYSKRFLIKSMQLVGATRKFIVGPFAKQSMINGVISGVMASALLMLFLFFVNRNLNILNIREDLIHYAYICFSVILIGVLLSYWSTKAAVVKYLKLKLDELY